MIDMSQVESIRALRKDGGSIAAIARKTGVSEPTVRKYLAKDDFSPVMPTNKKAPSKLDPYKHIIDGWIEEDRQTWRKQRHTARRIHGRLTEEHGAQLSYNLVQRYVKQRRAEAQGAKGQFLDLMWAPAEAQVDFGQADFCEMGVKRRLHYLVMAFPYSNVGLAQVFYGENAECVCEGLQNIFGFIDGIPLRIVFDNATGIGRRVCDGIRLTHVFKSFCAHYGFGYSFCNANSGHEKGAVENKVGAIRRALFVPVPRFDSICLFNKRLLDRCMGLSAKDHYLKGEAEAALFQEDRFALLPVPENGFCAVDYLRRKTDKYGRVCLGGKHWYSSDPAYGKTEVVVGLTAFTVTVFDPDSGLAISEHRREYGDKPTDSADPASQLALLARKPGGWKNSQVRYSLPEDLRRYMDSLGTADDLKHDLRVLRDVSEEWGYLAAVEAMRQTVARCGYADQPGISILANGIACGRETVTYEEAVDLASYDEVFSVQGGDGQ